MNAGASVIDCVFYETCGLETLIVTEIVTWYELSGTFHFGGAIAPRPFPPCRNGYDDCSCDDLLSVSTDVLPVLRHCHRDISCACVHLCSYPRASG